jgi:tRNA(Leu) C34 or U34 (ribose-2'-O)-methylase TrmL
MPGAGFCLNTSQAANIIIYEAVKQLSIWQFVKMVLYYLY